MLIEPVALPGGVAGATYGATLIASGGAGKGYAWTLRSGTLPPGIGGLPAAGVTARLTGMPGAEGSYTFTVELRDADDATVTRRFTVVVGPPGGGNPGNRATSKRNAPGPREGHTAVWTGTEMIVWGGFRQTGPLSDGGAYDPANDRWRTIANTGAPSPRFAHTAIWSGSEMIVFGGWNGAGILGDGAAYDPATNTWRALPAANAPAARANHTAVWTGTAMIVWGGEGVFPPPRPNSVDLVFADGASYDPVANRWTPVPAGGPGVRSHTGVWTGTRMIVWGGRDAFALTLQTLNVGGVHDPVGGGWTATSQAGVPAARMVHTAVWAGVQGMIVWGGLPGTVGSLNTGGRYQPGTNTWTPTSVAGAPIARSDHTAVWSGVEMVVWGGNAAGAGVLAGGAAYRPSSDTWRSVNAGFVTEARAGHTAVWTGTTMIFWGGRGAPADTTLDTGGVITP